MNSSTTQRLDVKSEGIDPSDFETWRKASFAYFLASKSGSNLAGTSLAFNDGHVDFAILADPECPEDMTAVSPLITFLGTKFYSALNKGQVYQYMEHWIAAGRPTTYQWPQTPGRPTQGPVTITAFDPCWSVKPRESTTAAQRAKNLAEGRISEFKKYLKSFQVAVSMLQENLSESMNQEMASNGDYRKAIANGDLLAMMAALERKAICGHRMEE